MVENRAAFTERFDFEVLHWKLRQEVASGQVSQSFLLQYIHWAYSSLQYSPEETVYSNMIDALIIRGSFSAALRYAKEGVLIFPGSKLLTEKLAKLERRLEGPHIPEPQGARDD
jgi:hypothetical protein